MLINLSVSVFDLKKGETGKVIKTEATGGAAQRLKALGITSGGKVTVLAFSLFKSSVLISCGAARVALRASLAKIIYVQKI